MQQDIHSKIDQLRDSIKCQKDFSCINSNFKQMGKARDLGLNSFIECMEEPNSCTFDFSYGNKKLCSCPLRVYISQNLKK